MELEDSPHSGSYVHAPEAAHSSLMILEGFHGLRESCYIMVTVCVRKEKKTRQSMESLRGRAGGRMGDSPSTKDCSGDVRHARDCLRLLLSIPSSCQPLGHLMPYWPLGFRPSISLLYTAFHSGKEGTMSRWLPYQGPAGFCPSHVLGSEGHEAG